MGVLSIYYPQPKKFTTKEKKFFGVFTSFIATFFETYFSHQRLQKAYKNIAQVLVNSLEEKDPYTRGHSERVRELAVKIAQELDLPADTINLISDISVMHDNGKIIVDSSILNKPAPLDDKEWKIIREHPTVGTSILSPIVRFAPGLSMIKHHHERIDGNGYPDGLEGDSIPVIARILAVADAYDAMNSSRPYRDKLTKEQIRRELTQNTGSQFEGRIVETLLELI